MRATVVEIGRMFLAFFAASVVLTGLALAAAAFGTAEPGRLARKLLVPLFIGLYLWIGRLRRDEFRDAVGAPFPGWVGSLRHYALGWTCGVVSLVALCALLVALGGLEIGLRSTIGSLLYRALRYLGAGLVLAILEEVLFRGVIHYRLQRAGGTLKAVLIGSVLFAGAHFLRPPKGRPTEGFEGAWDVVPGILAGVGSIGDVLPQFAGLFGVGLILVLLRVRTGAILIPMGVHAGWFWVRSVDAKVLRESKAVLAENPLLYGTLRFYDGILGWCALALTLVLVAFFTRPRQSD